MTARNKRFVLGSALALLALGYGFAAYYSFTMDEAMTAIVRKLIGKPPIRAVHRWDEWLLASFSGMAALGAIVTIFRKAWSFVVSMIAFGLFGLWSLAMAFAPSSLREAWFSITVDRWAAAIITLISFGALSWLRYPRQRKAFFQSENAA